MFVFRIYLTGVVYTLTWQFAQFVSLLQALILFILATLGLIDRDKVSFITSSSHSLHTHYTRAHR